MANEMIDSIRESVKERLSSSVYGTYFIFWIIFHHRFIFALFFTSEQKILDKTQMLKSEYLSDNFFNLVDWKVYAGWAIPAALTWLFIKYFPKYVSIPLFKIEQSYESERKLVLIDEKRKIEVGETKLEKASAEKLEAVVQKVKKEKEVGEVDPTQYWEIEYQEFKKTLYFRDFNLIIEAVYQRYGNVSWYNEYSAEIKIPQGILVYAHTHDLIKFRDTNDKIDLTEKGKFFVKEFSDEAKI